MVVWKSTRNRQHARGTFSEASSPSSRPVTPAELQVREIASKIGLFDDSEILATVCHKMRKEYVVEEWQLPALDSRQWEKMQAPIGLAVAVQHISSHQLREQEIMELRLREEYNNNVQTYNKNLHNESLLEDEKEEDPIVSSSFHKDMAKSTSSSAGSSKQEEKEIVAKTASDANLDIVQVLALATSDDFSAIATDEDIYDEPNKTGKVVAVNENELDDEGNHPPPASDYLNESGEFSDDCSDCLKLSKVATAKDNNGTLEREEECNRGAEATTASPEIDHKDIDDQNGGINSTMVPVSSVKMAEVARTQANFEPVNGIKQNNPNSVENKMGATQVETEPADTLESENSIASLFVENKQEQAQVEIEPMNTTEREIFPTIEKIIETVQVITEPVNGMEQESSTLPSKIEREQEASQENSTKQEVSRVEIKPVERDSDSTATPKHLEQMETPLVENDNGDGRDSATTSMHVPKKPQEDFDIAKTGEIQETGSSDAESDVNTDIFSGISKNVSFSDDEDEPMLADKETTKLDCLLDTIESSTDDTAISSINKLETHRLLYAENYADDITVAISNVSPELLLLAAKRKKKMKKYRQKLDEDKKSFEIETAVLQDILVHLPDDDHRTILSQLMIMTNARDKESRTSIALQVQDHLLALIEKNGMDVDCEKAVQFIFHLSRMKKSYRLVFGKSLFKSMSKIYKRTEKLKEKNSPKRRKKEEKNAIVDDVKNLAQDEQETQQEVNIKDEVNIEDESRVESGSLHI